MSQELTDNPPGIWGLGYLFVLYSINMSPRWGLGVWGLSTCYKHVAPLGLKNVGNFSSYRHIVPPR